MANRRMIPKTLSISTGFNSVSEFAQLLYVMMQPYTDDFGKLDGDPAVVKALVLPMNNRPIKDFENAIEELASVGQIEFYKVDKQKVINIPTFEEDQTGINKRTKSKYPSNSKKFQEILGNTTPREAKGNEINTTKINISEENNNFADKDIVIGTNQDKTGQTKPTNTYKNQQLLDTVPSTNINNNQQFPIEDPAQYKLKDAYEVGAKMAWERLEPNNPTAFFTTYLSAAHKGLPVSRFYLFVSEILMSKAKKPGAVFNTKVKDYFDKKRERTNTNKNEQL